MRLVTSHISIAAVRSEALFASAVQPSDRPDIRQVQDAIAGAVRQFGIRGCAERMAQEFGDHPQAALARMQWARHVVDEAFVSARATTIHSHGFDSVPPADVARAA